MQPPRSDIFGEYPGNDAIIKPIEEMITGMAPIADPSWAVTDRNAPFAWGGPEMIAKNRQEEFRRIGSNGPIESTSENSFIYRTGDIFFLSLNQSDYWKN
jgi:hypothetical protein